MSLPDEELKPEQPEIDRETIATAYHEAGHAVMAVVLGRNIEKATIVAANRHTGGMRLGVVKMQSSRSKATQDWLEDEVLILFAGMVAEAQYTGKYCPGSAMSDLRAIQRLLDSRANTQRQLEKLHRRLLDKTEYLLNDDVHRLAIHDVAQQLLEQQTIKGRTVKHLLNQARLRIEK